MLQQRISLVTACQDLGVCVTAFVSHAEILTCNFHPEVPALHLEARVPPQSTQCPRSWHCAQADGVLPLLVDSTCFWECIWETCQFFLVLHYKYLLSAGSGMNLVYSCLCFLSADRSALCNIKAKLVQEVFY